MARITARHNVKRQVVAIVIIAVFGSCFGTFASGDQKLSDAFKQLNELKEELANVNTMMVPVGTIMPYAGSRKTNGEILRAKGWLFCHGDKLDRDKFKELYNVIQTAFGSPDNKSFNLPDLRGRLVRGVDHGTGRDPDVDKRIASGTSGNVGDKVGSVQEENKSWDMIRGNLVQVSVGSKEYVWGVSGDRKIRKWNNNNWKNIGGSLKNVSVGADGTAWGVNRKKELFRWEGKNKKKMAGGFNQVSVGNKSHVWGIKKNGNVFQWKNNKWEERKTGTFKLLSVGTDGTVFLLKENGEVWRWNNNMFEKINGKLSYITVGNASKVWGIDTQSRVVKWDGKTWKPLIGAPELKSISASEDGSVWGVDRQGNIFRYVGETSPNNIYVNWIIKVKSVMTEKKEGNKK